MCARGLIHSTRVAWFFECTKFRLSHFTVLIISLLYVASVIFGIITLEAASYRNATNVACVVFAFANYILQLLPAMAFIYFILVSFETRTNLLLHLLNCTCAGIRLGQIEPASPVELSTLRTEATQARVSFAGKLEAFTQ